MDWLVCIQIAIVSNEEKDREHELTSKHLRKRRKKNRIECRRPRGTREASAGLLLRNYPHLKEEERKFSISWSFGQRLKDFQEGKD